MKKCFSLLLISLICAMAADAATKKRNSPQKKTIPLENIILHLDTVTGANIAFIEESDSLIPSPDSNLILFVKENTTPAGREAVTDHYEGRIIRHSEAGERDSLFHASAVVVAMNDSAIINMAFEGMAQYYATKGSTYKLNEVLKRYEDFSASFEDNPYKDVISELRKEYDDILNPVPFIDRIRGRWISYDWKNVENQLPYFSFDIMSLNNDGIILNYWPGFTPTSNDYSALKVSQALGGEDGFIMVTFANDYLRVGNDQLAQQGFQMTREFRANMAGNIASAKTSFGNKMAATAGTEIIASGLDWLYSLSAQSSKNVRAMNLSLREQSPRSMTGHAEYYNYSANVNNMHTVRPTPFFDNDVEFVKWEPEDKVYFVEDVNKIYSVTPLHQLDLSKYEEITKRYSWKHKNYLVPVLVSTGVGLGMMGGSIALLCSGFDKHDEYGNVVYNKYGKPALNTGKFVTSVVMFAAGVYAPIVTLIITNGTRMKKRAKAYKDLNEDSFRILKEKSTLSIRPEVDPGTNSYGIGASINF